MHKQSYTTSAVLIQTITWSEIQKGKISSGSALIYPYKWMSETFCLCLWKQK